MALRNSGSQSARTTSLLGVTLLGATLCAACGDGEGTPIGPDGGTLQAGKLTVTIPPGALTKERAFNLSKIDKDLSADDYSATEKAYELTPDVVFRIPAEAVYEPGGSTENPALLHEVRDRITAYATVGEDGVGHFLRTGVIGMGTAGKAKGTVDMPMLSQLPSEVNASNTFVDIVQMQITPTVASTAFDIVLTAYDMDGNYNRPLNDNDENTTHCGFKIENVQGALVTGGCINGAVTASVSPTAPSVSFEVIPFLIGKTDAPVAVAVDIGVGQFATRVGYFGFQTGPCFQVSCSGYGTCTPSGDTPVCNCNEGYANNPDDPLRCNCVPQCDGLQCGSDSCGGSCGNCPDGQDCDFGSGQCQGEPDPSTTEPDPSTTEPDPSTTMPDPSTTMPDPSTTTGMDMSTSSTTDDMATTGDTDTTGP